MKIILSFIIVFLSTCYDPSEQFLKSFYGCTKDDRKSDMLIYVSLNVEEAKYLIGEIKGKYSLEDKRELVENLECVSQNVDDSARHINFVYHRFYRQRDKIDVSRELGNFVQKYGLNGMVVVKSIYSIDEDGIKN